MDKKTYILPKTNLELDNIRSLSLSSHCILHHLYLTLKIDKKNFTPPNYAENQWTIYYYLFYLVLLGLI